MKKIKDKIEYISVEAQGSYACENDCVVGYTNKQVVGAPQVVNGPAITVKCRCTSKPIKTPSGWSGW